MDKMLCLTLWSKFIKEDNNLKKSIDNLIENENITERDKKIAMQSFINYFHTHKYIDKLFYNQCSDNTEKMFRGYVDVRMGIMAMEFDKVKRYKKEIYKYIIENLEKNDYTSVEQTLKNYNYKLDENYTPKDIYIMQGNKEQDYEGWY